MGATSKWKFHHVAIAGDFARGKERFRQPDRYWHRLLLIGTLFHNEDCGQKERKDMRDRVNKAVRVWKHRQFVKE